MKLYLLLCLPMVSTIGAEPLTTREVTATGREPIVVLLQHLVQTHPRIEIRHDLNKLIEHGKVALNFQAGMFGNYLATAYAVKVPGRGLMPALGINPEYLADQSVPTEYKQLVIYHEYIHLDQMLRGRAPLHTFFPSLAAAKTSFEEAVTLIKAEFEAYGEECELGKEIGFTTDPEFCVTRANEGEEAFRLHIVRRLLQEREQLRDYREQLYRLASEPYQPLPAPATKSTTTTTW